MQIPEFNIFNFIFFLRKILPLIQIPDPEQSLFKQRSTTGSIFIFFEQSLLPHYK